MTRYKKIITITNSGTKKLHILPVIVGDWPLGITALWAKSVNSNKRMYCIKIDRKLKLLLNEGLNILNEQPFLSYESFYKTISL